MSDTKQQPMNPVADALAQLNRDVARAAAEVIVPALAELNLTL